MTEFEDFVLFKTLDLEFAHFIVSDFDIKMYNVSGFDLKKTQIVRFWKNFRTKCQILLENPHNKSNTEIKFLQNVNFQFEIETYMILKDIFYSASDFDFKVLPGVRFWMRIFTMIQKLKKTFLKAFTKSTLDCFYSEY